MLDTSVKLALPYRHKTPLFFVWMAVYAIAITLAAMTNVLVPYKLDPLHIVVALLIVLPIALWLRILFVFLRI